MQAIKKKYSVTVVLETLWFTWIDVQLNITLVMWHFHNKSIRTQQIIHPKNPKYFIQESNGDICFGWIPIVTELFTLHKEKKHRRWKLNEIKFSPAQRSHDTSERIRIRKGNLMTSRNYDIRSLSLHTYMPKFLKFSTIFPPIFQ